MYSEAVSQLRWYTYRESNSVDLAANFECLSVAGNINNGWVGLGKFRSALLHESSIFMCMARARVTASRFNQNWLCGIDY